MSLAFKAATYSIKGLTRLGCKIDDRELGKIAPHGPLIVVSNHISFLEVPVIYTHLQPRPVTGFAKAESWNNPLYRVLFNLWGAIPIRRGEADLMAMRKGIEALKAGKILGISPEGTRSRDGRLRNAHPGVVTLALNSGAPLQPLVYYGGESLKHNLRRMRRTHFHIRVGEPFYLDLRGDKPTKEVRQKMVDEIMYQLAALLPPAYRGVYAGLDSATQKYLHFK
jgi:1-acyl-sn-glycerol-3-phosphate acyltransferase